MMVRKRKSHRGQTPTTTSDRWTGVRDPRAAVRFSLDERVAWDDGESLLLGVVIGFADDECAIRVRLENGSTVIWPTVSARLRRVQTPDFDSNPATEIEPKRTKEPSFPLLAPIGEPLPLPPVHEDYYNDMEVDDHDESRDTIDVTALTAVDPNPRRRS